MQLLFPHVTSPHKDKNMGKKNLQQIITWNEQDGKKWWKLIFPLQMNFQCGRMSGRQAICLHGMARQNCIRQFVTILSLNKTRDLKTEGFCTCSLCRKKPFFCMGTFCVLFLMRRNKIIPARFSQENLITWNDVGLPALFLQPELINNEIHCAYL